MRRTVEISTRQSIVSTAETVGLYMASETSGNRINIPRTSLSIFNAINMTFPEELSGKKKEALQTISNLSPVLIAANEAADIGVSASLRMSESSNDLTEKQQEGLRRLENDTFNWLGRSLSSFKNKYGAGSRESGVVDTITHDFILLSRERRKFRVEDYREYIELDSLIFTLGCIEMCAPDVLEKCGFDFGKSSQSVEVLSRKYGPFITQEQSPNRAGKVLIPSSSDEAILTMAQIMSLQGAEMVLKVKDDIRGRKIDRTLAIPNLNDYAQSQVNDKESLADVLETIRKEYFFLAKTGGLPGITIHSAEVLSHLTSVHKARRTGLKSLDEGTSIVESTTTTLRHELDAAGVLKNLFSSA